MSDDGLAIHVAGLRKTYRVPEREAGLAASMRSLLRAPKAEASNITVCLLADLPIIDLAVEEPVIEDVIVVLTEAIDVE